MANETYYTDMKNLIYTILAVMALCVAGACKENNDIETGETPVSKEELVFNGHEYVDLGIRDQENNHIYWAKCNIGADSPEDSGLYFAWGETEGYGSGNNVTRSYDWASYKWCDGTRRKMMKYITTYSGAEGYKTMLDAEDDPAVANWGGKWRMPTAAEMDMLRKMCNWSWDPGKKCYKVSNKEDESQYILLPAAGYRYNTKLYSAGLLGEYWTSAPRSESNCSKFLSFHPGRVFINQGWRCIGKPVRPVCVVSQSDL